MTYNGNGDVLALIFIHKGEIGDIVSDYFKPRISCINTTDGQLNYNVIGGVL